MKAIAIVLELLYNQILPSEMWAELPEAYRGWFGLISYPNLPGNTTNNSQIVRLPNWENSPRHLASTIPWAFSPIHYKTPESHESHSSLLICSPDQYIFNIPDLPRLQLLNRKRRKRSYLKYHYLNHHLSICLEESSTWVHLQHLE